MHNKLSFAAPAVLALAALATPVAAAIDVQTLVDQTALTTLSTDTDADPRTCATLPDGSIQYFEESEQGTAAENQLLSWNGSALAVVATEAQLAAIGTTSPDIGDLDDLVADASGTLYAIIRDTANNEYVARINPVGPTVTNMVDFNSTGACAGAGRLAVDAKNSRLIIFIDDEFDAGVPVGLYHVPLNATAAAPTLLADQATLAAALTGAANNDDLELSDITVQSDGDIICANGFAATAAAADFLRVTESGTVSLFSEVDPFLAAGGSAPPTGIPDQILLATGPSDVIIAYNNGGPTDVPSAFFAEFSADGSSVSLIIDVATIFADPDVTGGQASMNVTGRGLDVASNGDIYFTSDDNSDITGLFRMVETGASSVNNWQLHQ